jgi:hypothetical protein
MEVNIMVRVTSNPIEALVKDIHPDAEASKLYPFRVRVAVIRRRPPRHPFFEYLVDMGRGAIEDVLEQRPLKGPLTFVFPERWMGVAEQQAFMALLSNHPDAAKIKDVAIVTSCPLIVGNFMRTQVGIISWPDDDKYGCGLGA